MNCYTYALENAYMDNTKVILFMYGEKVDEQIVSDHELDGYCRCLEDFGYTPTTIDRG